MTEDRAELPRGEWNYPPGVSTRDVDPQDDFPALAAIRKLTKRQQEVLGMVMICQDRGQNPKILERLAGLGLIEKEEQLMHFRDGLPPMKVPRYFMTYEQNYAYCCWAEEQGEGEEP